MINVLVSPKIKPGTRVGSGQHKAPSKIPRWASQRGWDCWIGDDTAALTYDATAWATARDAVFNEGRAAGADKWRFCPLPLELVISSRPISD